RPPAGPPPFPYTTLFRSERLHGDFFSTAARPPARRDTSARTSPAPPRVRVSAFAKCAAHRTPLRAWQETPQQPAETPSLPESSRSEEHTSELQSREKLVC